MNWIKLLLPAMLIAGCATADTRAHRQWAKTEPSVIAGSPTKTYVTPLQAFTELRNRETERGRPYLYRTV
jgi:hypothetical protein